MKAFNFLKRAFLLCTRVEGRFVAVQLIWTEACVQKHGFDVKFGKADYKKYQDEKHIIITINGPQKGNFVKKYDNWHLSALSLKKAKQIMNIKINKRVESKRFEGC